jgi:hypothetical protein
MFICQYLRQRKPVLLLPGAQQQLAVLAPVGRQSPCTGCIAH